MELGPKESFSELQLHKWKQSSYLQYKENVPLKKLQEDKCQPNWWAKSDHSIVALLLPKDYSVYE